jgi:hypothetical protein
MLKLLGVAWTAWNVTRKRFGAVGAFLATLVLVAGYVITVRWLRDHYPELAERVE